MPNTCNCGTREKETQGGLDGYPGRMSARQRNQERETKRQRLRRMFEDGRLMGPPAHVPHLRPRRMLRFLQEQTRYEALSSDEAPHHAIRGTRRRLALVLRGRNHA